MACNDAECKECENEGAAEFGVYLATQALREQDDNNWIRDRGVREEAFSRL